MGEVSIIGLDLAKNVFQAHGAGANGPVVFRRNQMILADPILKTLRKQRHLIAINAFNEPRQKCAPVSQKSYHMLGFSHSLGPGRRGISRYRPMPHAEGRFGGSAGAVMPQPVIMAGKDRSGAFLACGKAGDRVFAADFSLNSVEIADVRIRRIGFASQIQTCGQ